MLSARDVIATLPTGRDNLARVTEAGRCVLLAIAVSSVLACAPARNIANEPVQFTEAAQTSSAVLMIQRDVDLIRLKGVLGSAEQVSQVSGRASELFGAEMIINDLTIDPAIADAQWVDTVLQTAESLQYVDEFSLVAGSGQMTVGGLVGSEAAANQIEEMVSDLAGLTLAVSTTMVYPANTSTQDVVDLEAVAAFDVQAATRVDLEPAVATVDVEAGTLIDIERVAGDEVDGISAVGIARVAGDEVDGISAVGIERVAGDEVDGISAVDIARVAGDEVDGVSAVDIARVAGDEVDSISAVDIERVAGDEVDGISVAIVPLAAIERQAVAVQLASAQSIAAVSSVVQVPASILVVPASLQPPELAVGLDTDADGVPDNIDACVSRFGYPVNERGCQSLDGYLKDVHFIGESSEFSEVAKRSLDLVAFTMLDHPVSKIAVLSYSKDGVPALMRKQARERGFAVVDYLIAKGVDQNRLQAFALSSRKGMNNQILIKEVD